MAEALLSEATNRQALLRASNLFTDYSGRMFNCTAYEYAFWAKDTYMCDMLASYMDEETKSFLRRKIDNMEKNDITTGQKKGLVYQQSGIEHTSAHFDLTPLIQALRAYCDGYNSWYRNNNWGAINAAWMLVGKAQRNLPAHVVHEYCMSNRPFSAAIKFNVAPRPRLLTFYNCISSAYESWFPLLSPHSGLGYDFALFQAGTSIGVVAPACHGPSRESVIIDLVTISRFDIARTAGLRLSREKLNASVAAFGMSI